MPIYNSFYQAQQQLVDIEAIDYFFAIEMLTALKESNELSAEQEQILSHVFFALSVSLRAGHTCLPLTELALQHWGVAFDEQGQCSHQGFIFPDKDSLFNVLTALDLSAKAQQPIVFENNRVYMRRYYQFEQTLVQNIKARLTQRLPTSPENISCVLQQLFPPLANDQEKTIDWQQLAVANAMNKNFTVIAGGPGTGKTYTVTKLLAALVMLNGNSHSNTSNKNTNAINNQALEIALVAPTGKAAQRLSESIMNAIAGFKELINKDVLAAIPTQAKTIHRLLGVIPNSPNFRHDQNNLLNCDVLLIDEVSMVDLPMMTRIFRALKSNTKIILLGDADQLPSVAVGGVLADIAPRPHSGYSADNAHYLAQVCQLDIQQLNNAFEQTESYSDHLSFLVTSRRFDGEGGIGRLAAHVIKGENTQSWQLLKAANERKENQLSLVDGDLYTWLSPLIKEYYQGISQCSTIDDAFALLTKFRILCVTRQGEFGVDAINQWVKEQLAVNSAQPWGQSQQNYHGMPIMISENDYRLGLFNGDIGLLWRANSYASDNSSRNSDHLMAFFEQPKTAEGETHYKTLLPSRLPKYDSVYAMTIHKTQGSEFAHVAMLLPKQSNNLLLSRELLYTGITRAKTQLTIASNKQTWQQGVISVVKRYSGLKIVE
ncbi:exodeoxyribonuclease V subunit alpha [Candidatus Colwellia aromaticivorans]|uniref:exodeoxyribonuclease V subunit alpha n=1 Tax=Candidatus Colwellia aromaticivorans TaxID=2267621 RepID=UPI001FEAE2FF|nr:exodeoxyribonuclease V subunit alpha [Candidatus Colwellia aromaticivorans]